VRLTSARRVARLCDMDVPKLADGTRRVILDGARVFVKTRTRAPPDFFAAEARGLCALRNTGAIRVPAVLAANESLIVLEDLGDGCPGTSGWDAAGRGLAEVHRTGSAFFGFETDGYCGDSLQDNSATADGFKFFCERRLLPQARHAFDRGLLQSGDVAQVESICARLRELLPQGSPVLIHGDLWTGNLHACASGEIALIDGGAVHFGWPECDLAMLTLFGEPPRAFFAAYESAAAVSGAWRGRASLLNLYHLLNHLNMFGSGYAGGVRKVLRAYA